MRLRRHERRIGNRAFLWIIAAILLLLVAAILLTRGFIRNDAAPPTAAAHPQAPDVPGGGRAS